MTNQIGPEAIVLLFNDCINCRDIQRLASLIADDHVFIDSAGTPVRGKGAVVAAWRGFFETFPDYRNVFEQLTVAGHTVTVEGRSTCSFAPLAGPALWTAEVEGGKVTEWRVYEDLPEIRARLMVGSRG
jgi:ketosteroid isomerase-like protein